MTGSMRIEQEALGPSRMREMLEHVPHFVVLLDRTRRFVWINRLDETLQLEQVIGHRLEDFIHADDAPRVVEATERAFSTGTTQRFENRGYAGDGEEHWYRNTVVPLPATAPSDARALLVSVEITERYLAERALRESEGRFRMLIEASPDLIGIVDREQRLIYVNRDPASETGRLREAMLGKRIGQLTHRDDVARAVETVARALEQGEAGSFEAREVLSGRTFLNRVIRLSSSDQEPQALVTAIDVTEQRRAELERASLEAQLQQAQKLEMVGQLAGGVAHDFNNVLLVIQGHLEFALAAVAKGTDPTRQLRAIAAAADRASRMTQRLLTIGRREPRRPERFDLAEFAAETMSLLDGMMPESITLELRVDDGPFPVHVDRAQLEQVLINLLLNARDAIDGVGRIRIGVNKALAAPAGTCADWFAFSVTDTGTGMDEATASRAFEPFFTTKPKGKGTGLGLSMVHSIVTENGGRVEVQSAPESGSRFTVYLRKSQRVLDAAEAPSSTAPKVAQTGKILVAEDEEAVRAVVVQALQTAGYDVIEASNGREAIELFHKLADEIDLVLLDAVMPVLGGKEAYEAIVCQRPEVKVLFSSGYSAEALPRAFLASRNLTLLPKPYGPGTLLKAIRQALGGSTSGR